MSPVEVELLLHTYSICEPYPWPIAQTIADDFVREGVLVADKRVCGYQLTPLGIALVEMILSTPMPVPGFFDPRTGARLGGAS